MFIHILLMSVSYTALLILLMPATVTGMLQTVFPLLLGLGVIVWKHPRTTFRRETAVCDGLALLLNTCLGLHFYSQWIPSSKVQTLASMLRLPHRLLVAAAAAGLALCAVIAVSAIMQKGRAVLRAKEATPANHIRICIVTAFVLTVLEQWSIEMELLSMGGFRFLWNVLIVTVVLLLLYCVSRSVRLSAALGGSLFMVHATVNAYVYQFRSRLFEPVDIFSAGTAMNVADNYSLFPVPRGVILCWGIWLAFILCLFHAAARGKPRLSRRQRLLILLCCLIGGLAVWGYSAGLKTYHWHREGAECNGAVLDFVSKFKEIRVSKPDGYSDEGIAALAEQYDGSKDTTDNGEDPPHIIVIMDEAFSDLSVIGRLNTDVEVTPFITSLKENVTSGYALSSVYGGNTANSEYEFLTGNSMAWLSPNVVPYQQYIRSSAYSMVSYLKTQYDYRCIAMHPYLSDGWNRPATYTNLGFDEMLFIEDFPQELLIRSYVSDQEMFDTVIGLYEENSSQPLFLFGVSMQNHGGYTDPDYEATVSLVGYEGDYPEAEQYLSLVHETDRAVEQLISYFEAVEDDVVIVFFGDHQPKLDEAFYGELTGEAEESLDTQQDKHKVPFFVWTNYDSEERYVSCTSLNFLSSYAYEAAGIPLPSYQRFLSEMEQAIPAINANGFYSLRTGAYLSFDEADSEEQLWLNAYEQLQYNSLLDSEKRNSTFFPTLEKTSE